MGIYHPRTRAGVAHYADPAELPAKKVWSWGGDADGLDWRKALSDNGSAEAEIQAGLFRDQETYAFLAPQEEIRFHETWLPVREIGGFSRVTPEAVLNVEREPSGALRVGLNVEREPPGRRRCGSSTVAKLLHERTALARAIVLLQPGRSPATAGGRAIHASRSPTPRDASSSATPRASYDNVARSEVDARTAEGAGGARRRRSARTTTSSSSAAARSSTASSSSPTRRTRTACAASPRSFALAKAAGRLAVALKRYEDAVDAAPSRRGARDAGPGDRVRARPRARRARRRRRGPGRASSWPRAPARRGRPALLQLARLDASRRTHRRGARPAARGHGRVARDGPRGRARDRAPPPRRPARATARERLAHWLAVDPTSGTLRHENVLLGGDDPGLCRPPRRRAAADPRRGRRPDVGRRVRRRARAPVARVAEGRRRRRAGRAAAREPPRARLLPRVLPGEDAARTRAPTTTPPRGCRRRTSSRTAPSRCRSSSAPSRSTRTTPPRTSSSARCTSAAAARRPRARRVGRGAAPRPEAAGPPPQRRPDAPLHAEGTSRRRARCSTQGLDADPRNPQVYLALDQALELLGRPAAERAAALQRYPTRPACRPRSSSSSPSSSPTRAASTRPSASSAAASSRARSSARTCAPRGSRCGSRGPSPRLGPDGRRRRSAIADYARPSGRRRSRSRRDGLGAFLDEPRFQSAPRRALRRCATTRRAPERAGRRPPPPATASRSSARSTRTARPGGSVPSTRRRGASGSSASLEAIDTRLVVGHELPGPARRGARPDARRARP